MPALGTIILGTLFNFLSLLIVCRILESPLADAILVTGFLGFLSMHIVFYFLARFQKHFYSNWFKFNEPKYLSIVVFLVFLLFATQSVLNVDRSRSFYILAWIHEAPKEATVGDVRNSIELSFGDSEARAFDQRLHEHMGRKIIRVEGNRAELTHVGYILFTGSEFLSDLYDLDGWKGAKLRYSLEKSK